jgi:hypothetical protein
MGADSFLSMYERYLSELRDRAGNPRSKVYIKDKISRLRRLLKVVGYRSLASMTENNFVDVIDLVMVSFPRSYVTSSGVLRFEYGDYLVVLRQLYNMNTGKDAPKNLYYGGVRVARR